MKKYTRKDFLKLPAGTIYSEIPKRDGDLMRGLFCKPNNPEECGNEWLVQDLISEVGFPNGIKDGIDAYDYQTNLRDTFQDFRTDLHCSGRDGTFDDSDEFVVWDKEDITKLRDYLNSVL